jgi:GDP-D-mannose dehydratase
LLGDATKAHKELNWHPNYNFESLVNDMIESKLIEYTKGGE